MAKYIVRVYDCSFVQDYVMGYESTFTHRKEALAYGEYLMREFAELARFEYSVEFGYLTECVGFAYYTEIGYWEFDFAHTDEDIIDLLWSLDDYKQLSNFSYHEMF